MRGSVYLRSFGAGAQFPGTHEMILSLILTLILSPVEGDSLRPTTPMKPTIAYPRSGNIFIFFGVWGSTSGGMQIPR